jgi:hypothetical protein
MIQYRKKYEYTGKCIKNNDKLLNACKSNAKYTFELKNNCIQYIFAKLIEKLGSKNERGDPYIFFCPGANETKGGTPGYTN